jgi:hypothetical protein
MVLLGLAVSVGACDRKPAKAEKPASQVKVPIVPAAHVPRSMLTDLRWLMGSWRGEGAEGTMQEPFFERYSIANDSTLFVEVLRDSTFIGMADSTRYDLLGDVLASDEAIATTVSPTSLTFTSRKNSGLTWTWRRDSDSSWTALIVTPTPNAPPRTRTYRMTRIR